MKLYGAHNTKFYKAGPAISQLRNIVPSHHRNIATSQHCAIAPSQYRNFATLRHRTITISQLRNIAPSHHCNIATSQHCAITPSQYRNFATLRHRTIAISQPPHYRNHRNTAVGWNCIATIANQKFAIAINRIWKRVRWARKEFYMF